MINTNTNETVLDYFNPVKTFIYLWRNRYLLKQLTLRNIQTRYRGSFMGLLWLIITPLIMLTVYTFIFSVVFQVRWGTDFADSTIAFALILYCGLTVFNIFSESINSSVDVIIANANYVKKVIFPLEILPVSMVLTACCLGMISIMILLVGVGIFLNNFSILIFLFPLIFLPLLLLCSGIAFFVASLGVFIRDLRHIVGLAIQILFFMTPIFYNIEMVPENLRNILLINPLSHIVSFARNILIYNNPPNWILYSFVSILSLFIFQFGYAWFMKTKRGFADVI